MSERPALPGIRVRAPGRSPRFGARVVLAATAWSSTFLVSAAGAQSELEAAPQRDVGYVARHQAVRDASSDHLALLVASHPDDRYVLLATYLRFQLGLRVAVLLFTRGKGGQNSSGPETGDALGELRTQESHRCAAHLGVKVYYLNRPDNGYCRTASEALHEWGEKLTVVELTRLIRTIQPDLVMTTHHSMESHGHDLALIQVLPKAVKDSGDPSVEIPGTKPFVVSRLFRGANEKDEDGANMVSLEMDNTDPVRGRKYRQLAYAALKEHKSQAPLQRMDSLLQPIMDVVSVPIGEQPVYSELTDGLPDVFTALQSELPEFDASRLVKRHFDELTTGLADTNRLSTIAIGLLERLRAVPAPPGSDLARRIRRRRDAVERVILESAGVEVSMEVPEGVEAAPGEEMPLWIWIENHGAHTVTGIRAFALNGGELKFEAPGRDKTTLQPKEAVPLVARYVPPNLDEHALRAIFSGDTFERPLRLRFEFAIDGQPISVERVIDRNLQPTVKITVTPRTLLLPAGADSVPFVVGIERKTSKGEKMELRVKAPAGMRVRRGIRDVPVAANEKFREFTFTLNAPGFRFGVAKMFVHVGDNPPVEVWVHKVDVRVEGDFRVGLLPGVDRTNYEVLQAMIGDARLDKFEANQPLPILDRRRLDTIVVDIRAMRSRAARSGFARLLEFVRDGGRLVVFYHKDQEFNVEDSGFRGAPYPLVIGKGRVTRRDAPVRVLVEDHPLFHYPNSIRPKDWDGWTQERGLYFPESYDKRYQPLLEMQDPNCPMERGSLLYAKYGKGDYIYCALSLYRQLKNRHEGACRLFANMISPPRSRE